MMMRATVSAIALGFLAAGAAHAQTAQVTASTDLNLRAGPGPDQEIVNVIAGGDAVSVAGCLEQQNWCEVTYDGTTGWAYADYLTTEVQGDRLAIYEARDRGAVNVGTATFDAPAPGVADTAAAGAGGAAAGAATGALAGALLGPIGVGAGAAIGAAAGGGLAAADTVTDYVTRNPVDPVYLEGEVVTGARLPENVNVYDVPEADYRYAYVNELPVVVNPGDRTIIHIVR